MDYREARDKEGKTIYTYACATLCGANGTFETIESRANVKNGNAFSAGTDEKGGFQKNFQGQKMVL